MGSKLYPSKLFIEPTTACNLKCRMCVKQSRGNAIVEGSLARARFRALADLFPHLDTVVFSGIGEPLLHPGLEEMIAAARFGLPDKSWIGLQTNGRLLDNRRAAALIKAGVDRICVSMDAASDSTLRFNRSGTEVAHVEKGLQAVNQAKEKLGSDRVQLGIEYVVMRNNLAQLPRALEQAARHGATFAIVSQMLPYNERITGETLYTVNTDASLRFFRERKAAARRRGLDLANYLTVRWKYIRSARDQELITFVEEMISKAAERRIPFHFRKLLSDDQSLDSQVKTTFDRACEIAAQHGLDLNLPARHPRFERQCEFVHNQSVFLAWDGRIYPCYMLWHQYNCFFDGRKKAIAFNAFGRVPDQDILEIWNAQPYADFRKEAADYEFPYCSNCNVGPCDLITSEGFEHDCFAMEVPCGDCPWCMGLMQCLQ